MIRLKDQIIEDEHYKHEREDLLRLQGALFVLRGVFCTLDECGNIWQNYSWSVAASWLFFPEKQEDIIRQIENATYFVSFEDWADEN